MSFQVAVNNMLKVPKEIPEKGFYYHYKHDPKGTINNYAYELIGVGIHSEDDCRPEDANMAIYLPMYESRTFKAGKFLCFAPTRNVDGKRDKR